MVPKGTGFGDRVPGIWGQTHLEIQGCKIQDPFPTSSLKGLTQAHSQNSQAALVGW